MANGIALAACFGFIKVFNVYICSDLDVDHYCQYKKNLGPRCPFRLALFILVSVFEMQVARALSNYLELVWN